MDNIIEIIMDVDATNIIGATNANDGDKVIEDATPEAREMAMVPTKKK